MMIMVDDCDCSYCGVTVCDYGVVDEDCFFASCDLFSMYLVFCTLRIRFFWPNQASTHFQTYHQLLDDYDFSAADSNS